MKDPIVISSENQVIDTQKKRISIHVDGYAIWSGYAITSHSVDVKYNPVPLRHLLQDGYI